MKKLLSLFALLALICIPTYVLASTWTSRETSSFTSTSVASDSDGSNLIVGSVSSTVRVSGDGGASWDETSFDAGDEVGETWVASDADGSNLVVAIRGGRVQLSENSGVDWSESQPNGNSNISWRAVASDADGSNLVVAAPISLYTSANGGDTWTARNPASPGIDVFSSIASDDDGSNLIAGGGRLYTSADGGVNWTERQPAGDAILGWTLVASDADGSNLIAGNETRLYTSTNGGANWTERQPAGDQNLSWVSGDSDADGSNLIVGVAGGRLYSSVNGGVAWGEEQPAGDTDRYWSSVASDDDGSDLIVANNSNEVYTSPDDSPPVLASFDPVDNALEVAVNALFEVTFNKNIATSTGNILLKKTSDDSTIETIDVTGPKVTISGDTLVINPTTALATSTGYYFLIDAGAIEDTLGNVFGGISSKTTWNFTADAPPIILTFNPTDDSTGVALSPTISFEFNQGAVAGVGFITIKKASDDSTFATFDVEDSGEVDFSAGEGGTIVSIIDSGGLASSTDYYILIDSGAIEDTTGNIFTGISDETTWSFATEEGLQIGSFSPVDGATSVAVDGFTPVILFDRNVVAGTGLITLKKSSDDSTVETFDVTDGGVVDIGGETVTLSSLVALDYETGYYFLMDTGAIEDQDGNPFAGISDETTWNFTTEVEPPPLAFEFERVSVDEAGEQVFDPNQEPALSADGRYVAFESGSDGVVAGDENGVYDIFVYDRTLDVVEMVSMNDEGDEGDANSQEPSISSDGRYVAFHSTATNLVAGDTNDSYDVFVYDRTLDVIERVSVGTSTESNGNSYYPSISADSRYVAFYSDATNLVAGDTNDTQDIFVYDRTLDTSERVSLTSEGEEGDGSSSFPVISTDGRYISFQSNSTNLIADDTNGNTDVFVFDRDTDIIERVSVNSEGEEEGDGSSYSQGISGDGRYVIFTSEEATNLVEGVTVEGALYLHDRTLHTTEVVGQIYLDTEGTSGGGSIDAVGRYIAFTAYNGETDETHIYRYDRETDEEVIITEGGDGEYGVSSNDPSISGDGLVIAFASILTNLVLDDTNGETDIFVYEEVEEEEPPAEEEDDNSGGGSSHRRTGIERSSSDEDSDIEFLTERIEELKKILTGLLNGVLDGSSPDFTYTRNLTLGDIGDDVRQLQLFLINQNKGPAAQALAANGTTTFFGPLTQAALAEYQASVGIVPPAGFFGPITRAWVNGL